MVAGDRKPNQPQSSIDPYLPEPSLSSQSQTSATPTNTTTLLAATEPVRMRMTSERLILDHTFASLVPKVVAHYLAQDYLVVPEEQRLATKTLESWLNYRYLYDINEDNSEQDYISKLYAPIMESCFHESDIRLRCKVGYACKIDMRVTVAAKKPLDLSVVEYAKKVPTSKYYKDKVKSVLCCAVYLREYQKQNSNAKQYYQLDSKWCAVEKIEDADIPASVQAIKEGGIKDNVNSIKYFKDLCIDMKNSFKKPVSMKTITRSSRTKVPHAQKPLWFSDYKFEDSDND
ncbi:hypothetical protein V8B55DRAFT_1435452 [Mucor lusitanicus]